MALRPFDLKPRHHRPDIRFVVYGVGMSDDRPELEGYDTRWHEGGEAFTPEERAERERLKREAEEEAYEQARKNSDSNFRTSASFIGWSASSGNARSPLSPATTVGPLTSLHTTTLKGG